MKFVMCQEVDQNIVEVIKNVFTVCKHTHTTHVCITVSRHVYEMVGHVQSSVRKIAKRSLKEFKEVSEVSNTAVHYNITAKAKIVI